jgi:hypothetical protein
VTAPVTVLQPLPTAGHPAPGGNRGGSRSVEEVMRSKARTLIGGSLIAAALVAGCSAHANGTRGAKSTRPAERFPYIAPTAAATAAIDAYPLDRNGRDCGGGASDRGFPTTMAPVTTTSCLRDADRAATKAFMVFTGRDGGGGALLTSYRTEGSGNLSVLDVYADPSGKVHVTRWACAVPQADVRLSLGFGGAGHESVAPFADCQPG